MGIGFIYKNSSRHTALLTAKKKKKKIQRGGWSVYYIQLYTHCNNILKKKPIFMPLVCYSHTLCIQVYYQSWLYILFITIRFFSSVLLRARVHTIYVLTKKKKKKKKREEVKKKREGGLRTTPFITSLSIYGVRTLEALPAFCILCRQRVMVLSSISSLEELRTPRKLG